jgi:hypothetical protein
MGQDCPLQMAAPMRIHLLLCGGLLAACATNSHPSNEEEGGGSGDVNASSGSGTDEEAPSEDMLSALFLYEPVTCDDHSVRFYGKAVDASSTIVDPLLCHWDFGDGTEDDGCIIQHSMPSAANVVLTVRDPVTGATGHYEEVVEGPLSFDASLDVTGLGLSISWHAATQYGPYASAGSIQISIQPATKVIVADPSVFSLADGSVSVTEAGTYTVALDTSLPIGETGWCTKHLERTVIVSCPGPVPL